MGLVRDAVVKHVVISNRESRERWQKRHKDRPDRLFVSDLGGCVRKSYLRLRGEEVTHPFDPYVLEVMKAGKLWEWETTCAMRRAYGTKLQEQVPVGNKIWSGRIDYLLPGKTIIEHKATNPVNFKYGSRLPYVHHCLQVLAYRILLGGGEATLYYRAWDQWAELDVWQHREGIAWDGEFNGKHKSGLLEGLDIVEEMARFEEWWDREGLPPCYETPFEKNFACTKRQRKLYRPACSYFGFCWPQYPQDKPFKED